MKFTSDEISTIHRLVATQLEYLDDEAATREVALHEGLTLHEKQEYGRLQSIFKKITGKEWS